MTRYKVGGLNNTTLFTHSSGAWEFAIRVLELSGSVEGSLMVCRLPPGTPIMCPHVVVSSYKEKRGDQAVWCLFIGGY